LELLVDSFTSSSGWTGSDPGVSVFSENEIEDYIAGLNDKSLIFKFDSGSQNQYIEKSISLDLSGYNELVFHLWSRNKSRRGWDYRKSTDFAYKVDFGTGDVFYIPTLSDFDDVTIDISEITNITKIRITCLHDDEDYLIISNMIAVLDEFPLDIFRSIKTHLELLLSEDYAKARNGVQNQGILVASGVDLTAGDKSFSLSQNIDFVEKYSVIKIVDLSNSEVHQISSCDEMDFRFESTYDGPELLNSYTNASIYLIIPVEYGLSEKEIILPGISIWSDGDQEIFRSIKEEEYRDTFKDDGSVRSRMVPPNYLHTITIDCESRHNYLLSFMRKVVNRLTGREILWIDGKRIDLNPDGVSTFVQAVEGFNEIPKIQFRMMVELKEEVNNRAVLVNTTVINKNVYIR